MSRARNHATLCAGLSPRTFYCVARCGCICFTMAWLGLATLIQAQTQPANTLSILSYGAGTNLADNSTAIQNCINAAQAQGKGVWIPAGVYTNKNRLTGTGILIAGAGMTNSVLYRQQSSTDITATEISLLSCTVQATVGKPRESKHS